MNPSDESGDLEVKYYEIPIEIRALRTATLYTVKSKSGRKYLIDTGMRGSTINKLRSLNAPLESLDGIIITHLHIDHIGGAMALKRDLGIPIYMGKTDAELSKKIGEGSEAYLSFLFDIYRSNGVSGRELEETIAKHPMHWEFKNYAELEVDYPISQGFTVPHDSSVKVVDVPGHSPGSISLDFGNNHIFLGDHILTRITPNISFYDDHTDMLELYLNSLRKIKSYGYAVGYPGHGTPFSNIEKRIRELIDHHKGRLSEVLRILKNDWKTVFTVATEMNWSAGRTYYSMNQFEKNFAFGEAMAHIRHLVATELVRVKEDRGIFFFRSEANHRVV